MKDDEDLALAIALSKSLMVREEASDLRPMAHFVEPEYPPEGIGLSEEDEEDVDVLDYGETYTHPSDDDDSFAALPSFSSYTNSMPPATVASSLPKFGASAEHLLHSAQHRLRRFLSDTTAAVRSALSATRTPPSQTVIESCSRSLPQLLEALGELAVAATTETPASAALSLDARLYLSILVHATAAAAVVLPFAGEVDGCSLKGLGVSARSGTCNDEDDVLDHVHEIKSLPPMMPLVKMARFSLRTLEVALSPTPTAQSTSTTEAEQFSPSPQQSTAKCKSLSKTASVGSEAARYSMATLALLATHVELAQTVTVDALRKACAGLEEATAELLEVDGGGMAHSTTAAAIEALAASAPLQESLARLYSCQEEEEEDFALGIDISGARGSQRTVPIATAPTSPDRARGSNAGAATVSGTSAYSSCTPISEYRAGHEAAALVAALQQLQTTRPTHPTPGAAASESSCSVEGPMANSASHNIEWVRRMTVSQLRSQVASALRAVDGPARLAGVCTSLLLPLDLRTLVLSHPGSMANLYAQGDNDHERLLAEEHEDAASATLDLCSALMELHLAMPSDSLSAHPHSGDTAGSGRRVSDAGGFSSSMHVGAYSGPGPHCASRESPSSVRGLAEHLCMLRALLYTVCLSSNLPTGVANTYALGRLVGGRLAAIVHRGLIPTALRLVRREATLIGNAHAAPNAHLCVTAALSWALGASVPLSALFDPAGALGAAWPVRAAAGPDSAHAAWRALRNVLPLAGGGPAVSLLLRCARLLIHSCSPFAASTDAATPSRHEEAASNLSAVPVRLAGGFFLSAEAPCSAKGRLEALFALPGFTLLDSLLGLTLATSLRPKHVSGESSALNPGLIAETALTSILRCEGPSKSLDMLHTANSNNGVPAAQSDLLLSLLRFLCSELLGPHAALVLAPLVKRSLATRHVRAVMLLLQMFEWEGEVFAETRSHNCEIAAALALLAERIPSVLSEEMQEATLRAGFVTPFASDCQFSEHLATCAAPLRLPVQLLRFYAHIATSRLTRRVTSRVNEEAMAEDAMSADVVRTTIDALAGIAASAGATTPGATTEFVRSPLTLPHAQLLLLLWHSLAPRTRRDLANRLASAIVAAVTAAESTHLASAQTPASTKMEATAHATTASWRIATLRLLQLLDYFVTHPGTVPAHLPAQLQAQLFTQSGGEVIVPDAVIGFDLKRFDVIRGAANAVIEATVLCSADMYELCGLAGDGAVSGYEVRPTAGELSIATMHAHLIDALWSLLGQAHASDVVSSMSRPRDSAQPANHKTASAEVLHLYHVAWRLLGSVLDVAISVPPPSSSPLNHACTLGQAIHAARRVLCDTAILPTHVHSGAWLASAAKSLHNAVDVTLISSSAAVASAHALAIEQTLTAMRGAPTAAATFAAEVIEQLRLATAATASRIVHLGRASSALEGRCPLVEALVRASNQLHTRTPADSVAPPASSAVESLIGGENALRKTISIGSPSDTYLRWVKCCESDLLTAECTTGEERLLRLLTAHLVAPEIECSAGGHCEQERDPHAGQQSVLTGSGRMDVESSAEDTWEEAAERAATTRGASEESGSRERRFAIARLQLTLHSLLSACAATALALAHPASPFAKSSKPPSTMLNLKIASEMTLLGQEALQFAHDPWFGFCSQVSRSAAAAALPDEALRYVWSDLIQLRKLHDVAAADPSTSIAWSDGEECKRLALSLELQKLESLLGCGATAATAPAHALLFFRGVQDEDRHAPAISPRQPMKNLSALTSVIVDDTQSAPLGAPAGLASLLSAAPAGNILDLRAVDVALLLLRMEQDVSVDQTGNFMNSRAQGAGDTAPSLSPRAGSLAQETIRSVLSLGAQGLESWVSSRCTAAFLEAAAAATSSSPAAPTAPNAASRAPLDGDRPLCMALDRAPYVAVHNAGLSVSPKPTTSTTIARDVWLKLVELFLRLAVGRGDGADVHATLQSALRDRLWPILQAHLDKACLAPCAAIETSSSPMSDVDQSTANVDVRACSLADADTQWVAWGSDAFRLMLSIAFHDAEGAGGTRRLEELVHQSLRLLDKMREPADAPSGPVLEIAATDLTQMEIEGTVSATSSGRRGAQCEAACALLRFLGEIVSACEVDSDGDAQPSSKNQMLLDPPSGLSMNTRDGLDACDDQRSRDSRNKFSASTPEDNISSTIADSSRCVDIDEADADVGSRSDTMVSQAMRARQLACRTCTFATTGSNFTEQHWYYCYTCGLTQSEGCCSVCIRVCHAGHVVSYSRRSRFFCDCGAGGLEARGVRCLALTPRLPAASREQAQHQPTIASALHVASDKTTIQHQTHPKMASGNLEPTATLPTALPQPPALLYESRMRVLRTMGEASFVRVVFSAYRWLRDVAAEAEQQAACRTSTITVEAVPDLFPPGSQPKSIVAASDLAATRAIIRPGSFDTKPRFDAPHARDTRTLVAAGAISRQLVAANAAGLLMVVEGERLHVYDGAASLALSPPPSSSPSPAVPQPGYTGGSAHHSHRLHTTSAIRTAAISASTASSSAASATNSSAMSSSGTTAHSAAIGTHLERSTLRLLSKIVLGFEAVSIALCPIEDSETLAAAPAAASATAHVFLLVAGLRSCIILSLGSRGEVISRIPLDVTLDSISAAPGSMPPALLRACWLPSIRTNDSPSGGGPGCLPAIRCVAMLTSQWVKILDVSSDRPVLLRHYHLLDDNLKDIAFASLAAPNQLASGNSAASSTSDCRLGGLTMFVMGSSGTLYTQVLSLPLVTQPTSPNVSPTLLTIRLSVPSHLHARVGSTLYFSQACNLLFTSYSDGRVFALRLNTTATEVSDGFPMHPTPPALPSSSGGISSTVSASTPSAAAHADPAVNHGLAPAASASAPAPAFSSATPWRMVPHSHWQDVPGCPGLLLAACRKTLQAMLLCVTATSVDVQPLRPSGRVEGLVASLVSTFGTSPSASNGGVVPVSIWALHDDGSLVCHQPTRPPLDSTTARAAALRAALHTAFSRRTPQGTRLSFPVDAFERGACITSAAEITLALDASFPALAAQSAMRDATIGTGNTGSGIATAESERLKACLSAASDEHLSGSAQGGGGLTICVTNSSPTLVPTGVRVLVGATHPQRVPASITIFNRTIPTIARERRWYDLPFTKAESVAGLLNFTVTFSAVHPLERSDHGAQDRNLSPVLNAFEVFGISKSEFGLDAITRALEVKHLPPSPDKRLTSAGAPPRLMSALETALAQLRVFHIAAAVGAAPATNIVPTTVGLGAPEREQMLDYLPRTLLPHGCFSSLRKPTKALLRILEPRGAIYHEVKDRAMLRHSHAVVSLLAQMPRIRNEQRPDVALRLTREPAAAHATEGGLPALLPGLCKILRKRPHGFLQFLRDEPEFLTRLCAAAQAMQADAYPIGGSSASSVRQSVRQAYQSVVHILLTCASHLVGTPPIDGPLVDNAEVQAPSSLSLDALRPLFEHLIGLLLSSTEAVRIIIAAAVSRALLAPPNSNGLGGNTAGSTRVMGWGRTPAEAAPSGQLAIADDLLHAQEEALSVLGTSNGGGGAYRDLDVEEADEEEEEEVGGEDGEEEEEGFLVDPADTMDEEGGEEEEDLGISLAMDIDGAPESRGGPAHELEAEDQDGVSDGGEGEEEAMLAMALAMSLQQARQDGVLNEGDVPASATCESASPTSMPPDAEAAALESARAARRRQRYLVHCIRTLLLEYLPNLTGRPGITCIPFMQLLLQLSSTSSKFSDFNPATAPALSQTLSPLVVANSVAVDDTEQAISWGRTIADMLSDQLATLRSLDLSCRSIEMEQAILKILLLCLLLHNEKRSASLGTLTTPRVATLAGSSIAGPAATEASATASETHIASAMPSALASRLMARGICSLLHNLTHGLYVHFTAEGPHINDDDAITNVVASTAPSASRQHMPVHRSRTARHAANLHAGTSPHSSRILAPFFSDAYGKAHQHDLFEEANQLLLDAVLRLGQRLVQRGVPTSAFKAGQGIESIPISWSSLLCRIIHSPSLSFARKQAKKLLHVMCGSKTTYAEVRDRGLASLELDNVRRILGVSAASPRRPDGGSEQSLEHGYLWDSGHDLPPPPLTYESQLELSASLRKLHEAASAQPMNWVRFCAGDDGMTDSLLPTAGQETLAFLLRVAFVLRADASLIYVMKLLVLALGMPVPNTDTKASHTSASTARVHPGPDVGSLLRGIPLVHFVRVFALRASVAGVRSEACSVMRALWARAQQSADKLALFAAVATALPSFPLHGAACHELMEFLGDILLSSDSSLSTSPGSASISPSGQCPSPLSPATIREVLYALVRSFREQIALLQVHPNAQVYAALGGLIELDAHHLESVSCLAASRPESTPTLAKLETLRAETKFSESCQLVQLSACQSLHGGAVRIIEARRSMIVSCIRLYVNNQPVSDIGELKNQWGRWKRVKSLHIAPGQTDVRFDFAVPVVATNVLIEYAAFHENPAGHPEKLLCPRCSRSVADRHGICKHCGDNAYQCRHCRNINYEKLDAYLCNECGFCKHARFQWSFSVQPSFAVEPISSEADRARLQSLIDAELRAANRRLEQLDTHRRAITRLLASPHDPLVPNELSGAVAIPGASRGSATASGVNASSITTSGGTAASAASSSSAAGDALMAVLPHTAAALQLKPRLYLAATLYAKEAQASHDALFRSAQTLQAARAELLRYVTTGDAGADVRAVADQTAMEVEGEGSYGTLESQLIRDSASPPQSIIRNCRYDSGSAFVLEVLSLFERLCDGSYAMRDELLAQRIDEELLRSCLTNAPRRTQARAVRLLCLLSRDNAVATKRLNSELGRRLELCVTMHEFLPHERLLEVEVGLLCQLCRLQDSLWPERLAFMFRVLARGVEHLDSSHICRRLLLPCLLLVIEIVKGDESPAHSARNPFGSPSADRAQRVPAIDFGPWLCRPQIEFARWKEEVSGGSATSTTESRAEKSALRLGRLWRARAASRTTKLSQPSALRNWLCELLLCVPSPDVREAGSALLLRLADPGCCDANDSSGLQIADALMLSYLPRAVESGAATSSEFFKALATLLLPESRRLYLVARGCLSLLCQLIDAEAARMHEEEAAGAGAPVDLAQGRVLRNLVELLASLLGLKTVRARLRREARLPTLLHALLITRGLVMQRTCHTEEAALRLETLLSSLHDESEDQRSVYIASCVAAMREHAGGAAVVDAERLAASVSTPDAAAPDPYPHATLQATATRLPDARALTFILAQLCGLVCPERPEPDYALQLNKAPTQEEFIRGAMLKNPYTSRSIGPLMRDVKNRICRDLDMHGLIEDDNGMELLVAGSIIKLDLPVAAVYEQVWVQSAAAQALAHGSTTSGNGPAPGSNGAVAAGTSRASTPPMVVVYRLQGLDGEATEPIIETLGEEQGEDLDPETEFALSAVVGDEGGLELLVALLKRMGVPRAGAQRECASFVFRLLLACCRIRTNRRRVLSIGGIRQLLRLLPQALASQETEGMALQLLQTAGALLEEEARTGGAIAGALRQSSFLSTNAPVSMDVEGADYARVDEDVEWEGFVDHLLNGIERIRRRGDSTSDVGSAEGGDGIDDSNAGCDPSKGLCRAITRVLPLVSRGHPHLVRRIYAHFSPYADFGAYDAANGSAAARHAFMLSCLANILSDPSKRDDIAAGGEAIAAASAAAALKEEAVSAGLAAAGAAYLVRNFPSEKGGASQARWAAALGRPAVAHVLQLLVPLARGATSTGAHDALLAPEVMLRVHTLERQSSSAAKAIGTWAEALLEALREAGQAARVDELRRSTLASKRKAALDKRQRILSSMGMAQAPAAESSSLENGVASGERSVGSGKRRVILSQAHAAMMEELQEESGHICVVCGEGEAYRPGEPLGVYVFTKRVPLPPPFVLPDGGSATPAAARLHGAEGCAATSPSLAMGSCHNALGASSVTEWCHTTVTHFNTIHVRCHREASAAERALKTPKEEWEGATLRNSQTRTNGLWPIWGPSVSAETYASCVDTFWTQAQALGRADAPRLRLLVHNLRLLLLRFACEESFSRDSQGGGRESNLRFVPYMVQMGVFLLDTNGESQRRPYRRSLAMYLEAMEAATEHGAMKDEEVARITSSRDSVLYYLVLSLLAYSLNEWREARLRFLRIAIRHGAEAVAAERVPLGPNPVALSPLVGGSTSALRDGRSPVATSSITSRSSGGRGSGSSRSPLRRVARIELPPSPSIVDAAAPGIGHVGSSSDAPVTSSEGTEITGSPFAATRPALIFFALIDRFQSMLKEPRSWQPTVSSVDPRSGEAEKEWVSIMRERLQHHDQTLLSEVTSLLRDYETVLLPAASFEEAMDVMGLTAHVSGNGVISATQYVANLQGWP